MTSKSAVLSSALSEALVSAIWQGGEALPKAIAAERQALASELDALSRQQVAIEAARNRLVLRQQLLEDLAAGRGVATATKAAPATAGGAPRSKRSSNGSHPADGTASAKPPSTASPSTQMSPERRQARKNTVLDVARRVARRQGGEFSVRDLVNALEHEGVDLGVRDSHAATAVANIVFHSGDADFQLARRGVFRYAGADKGLKAGQINGGARP